MLCLTVYESKGLEFDEVILYNFFDYGSADRGHWKLLNDVALQAKEEGQDIEQALDQMVSKMEQDTMEKNKPANPDAQSNKAKRKIEEMQMVNISSKNRNMVYRKFALLCIELKYLYVAITRTKKRLIIFDENNKSRVPIQRIWDNLEVVEVLSKLDIEN